MVEQAGSWGRCRSGRAVRARAVAVALCAGASAGWAQTIRYVDALAPGGGDGLAWSSAWNSLQAALAGAPAGSEIRVAQGEYRPDGGSGDRAATFAASRGLTIRGGYAGLGTGSPGTRDIDLYRTRLSGDIGVRDTNVDNSYHVVTVDAPGATVELDGVRVIWGNADVPAFTDLGGGVLVRNGSLVMRDCVIADNSANAGGGVSLGGFTSGLFINTRFDRNAASTTGAGVNATLATLTMRDCVVSFNNALSGAGVYALSSTTIIERGHFELNWAQTLAGGAQFRFGQATVRATSFHGNRVLSSFTSGLLGGGAVVTDATALGMVGCDFVGNDSYRAAGAVLVVSGAATIVNALFAENIASTDGGAVNLQAGTLRLVGSVLTGNRALSRGGAIFGGTANPLLLFCTVFSNQSLTNNAGGVHMNGGVLDARSSVFWNNRNSVGTLEAAQVTDPFVRATFSNGCFQAWTGLFAGTGMTASSPQFLNAAGADGLAGTADDDLRPRAGSPLVDGGSTPILPADELDADEDGNTTEPLPVDVYGRVRRVDDPSMADVGVGPAPVPDVGAAEFQCLANLNGDDEVDLGDFFAFFNCYDAELGCADVDGVPGVDLGDFFAFFAAYDAGC